MNPNMRAFLYGFWRGFALWPDWRRRVADSQTDAGRQS